MSNNYSQKISDKEIDLILKYMSNHLVENDLPTIKYIFKTKNYKMTIYKNNTLLLQGKLFENILKLINVKKNQENSLLINDDNNKTEIISIGSDEVGTGDLFGGIVVCACRIINTKAIYDLNIRDSKLIKDGEIIELFHKIKDHVEYKKYEINPIQYNEIYDKYKNLNVIKTIGHYQTIKLLQEHTSDFALIDQYCSEKKFYEYLKILNFEKLKNFRMETKAESKYLEVACASIIARYFFVKQIKILSQEINMKLPFGSSHKDIEKILNKIKATEKFKFLKLHFKNAK